MEIYKKEHKEFKDYQRECIESENQLEELSYNKEEEPSDIMKLLDKCISKILTF